MPKKPLSRSQQMTRIKSRNTSPEVYLRKALWKSGLRYRLHAKTPVGRPDLVFSGKKVAVFVDGCFWHGCPIHYVRPRSRTEFWSAKLLENVTRDCRQTRELEKAGWSIIRIWEHELFTSLATVVTTIKNAIDGQCHKPQDDFRVYRVDALDEARNTERRCLLSLRHEETRKTVDGIRYTTKWKRPGKPQELKKS